MWESLIAAQRAVFDETKQLVCTRLLIAAGEFEGLTGAIHDQLDVGWAGGSQIP
jgi:hypothetical protein